MRRTSSSREGPSLDREGRTTAAPRSSRRFEMTADSRSSSMIPASSWRHGVELDRRGRRRHGRPVGLILVVAVGTAVAVWLRLAPLFADFAFGDGGLFWVMANDLRGNGFVPPDVTTYNAGGHSVGLPAAGIYLTALVGGGTRAGSACCPPMWAIATLPAVWLLARELIGDRGALVALVAYGLSGLGVLRPHRRRRGHPRAWAAARGPDDVGGRARQRRSGPECSADSRC